MKVRDANGELLPAQVGDFVVLSSGHVARVAGLPAVLVDVLRNTSTNRCYTNPPLLARRG